MAVDVRLGGAEVLDGTAAFIGRFVSFPHAVQLWTAALWVVHTHAVEAAQATPYLHVHSPVAQCGKSTLFEVLFELALRPLSASNTTPAALFRIIDAESVALLLDEIDAQLAENPEKGAAIRSILNAGYRRGHTAKVMRCVGPNHDVRLFDVFGPKAFSGVDKPGVLHATTLDRSVPLRLERKTAREETEEFRPAELADEVAELRAQIEQWVAANLEPLKAARPRLPDGLSGRAHEVWLPLVAIADLAGPPWDERAHKAAVELMTEGGPDEESTGLPLLDDLRRYFTEIRVEAKFSAELCRVLKDKEDRPWASWARAAPAPASDRPTWRSS